MGKETKVVLLAILILTVYVVLFRINIFDLRLSARVVLELMFVTPFFLWLFYKVNPRMLFSVPIAILLFGVGFLILAGFADIEQSIVRLWLSVLAGWFLLTITASVYLYTRHRKRAHENVDKESRE